MSAPQSGSPSPPPPSVEQSHPTESRWVPDERAKADVAPAKAGWGGVACKNRAWLAQGRIGKYLGLLDLGHIEESGTRVRIWRVNNRGFGVYICIFILLYMLVFF